MSNSLRKLSLLLILLLVIAGNKAKAQSQTSFHEGMLRTVKTNGWLKELLQRQHDGLTGHPEALSYPYNSCLWAGEISRSDETYGDNWWRYEQTAYYTEGLLKLGYELNDPAMVAKAEEGIEYTLAHPSSTGVLGNSTLEGITWPMSVFFRVLQAKYEHDGDERIPTALEKHYLNFTPTDLAGGIVGGRNIMSIEGILWTYGKTGNTKLLQLAEDAWAYQDCFAVDETAITSDEPFYMHSVTFCEMLKLPLLLYAYTGKTRYLDLAMTAVRKLERESMLPDGVPTSAEFLYGNRVEVSHETCDIVDYTWTLGHFLQVTGQAEWADKIERAIYNAGLGAITKDFRSLQYFSSLNQFIATGTSNHNLYKHGSTWMAYRPTHETECCSGNVNRMLPNFVGRMWMTDTEGGAVAALYAPGSAVFSTPEGDVEIACDTDYPADGQIIFYVKSANAEASIPLTLRIPTWCEGATLEVNGKAVNLALTPGTFVRLSQPVKQGDEIVLDLPMKLQKKTLEGQGVYFERGPLLYAYAIPQQMTEDLVEYECMHGKKPENPDFKCWSITPTGAWNYAYADDGREVPEIMRINIIGESTFYFYDKQSSPFYYIPVKPIKWELDEDRYTPALPEQGHLEILSDETTYIQLVPYASTELRLTVFPDADAQPLPPAPEKDYTRPADAPDCVSVVDGHYCAYFEMPRFCWDAPIYCKVRTADDTTTDMRNPKEGTLCEEVGTTANGRRIWRWTGPATTEPAPDEIIFTNNDMLTDIMPFANGGYYNYGSLLYKAGQNTPVSIPSIPSGRTAESTPYNLQGLPVTTPTPGSIYIVDGKKVTSK